MLGQFKWVYAVFSLIGGYIADRFSRRYVICASLFVWSVVTWSTGHATTYNELLWARSLMGISEAFYIPAALALIADYHIGNTRSRAVGLHQMAIYCGVILGGFGGYVAADPDLGWRFAFDACGVFGVALRIAACVAFCATRPSPLKPCSSRNQRPRVRRVGACHATCSFILLVLVLHAARDGGLGRSRLDARDSQRQIQHRPRQGRRGGHPLLASGGNRWRDRRRLARRSLDAAERPRADLCQRDRHVPDRSCDLWRRKCRIAERRLSRFWSCSASAGDFSTATTCRSLSQIVRPALARHRLWNHELRQHQLRRTCRLGLWRACAINKFR